MRAVGTVDEVLFPVPVLRCVPESAGISTLDPLDDGGLLRWYRAATQAPVHGDASWVCAGAGEGAEALAVRCRHTVALEVREVTILLYDHITQIYLTKSL